MKRLVFFLMLTVMLLGIAACTATYASTWQTSQLLNAASEPAAKSARLWGDWGNGFLAAYRRYSPGPLAVMYRRYNGSSLSGPYDTGGREAYAGNAVCLAGNGDIWVTWENWAAGNEEIYTAKSTDGINWTHYQITNYSQDGAAKAPEIVPQGSFSGSNVMCLSYHAAEDYLYHAVWNGSSWGANTNSGIYTNNDYATQGSCQSLVDGSVYRCYALKVSNVWQIFYRRWNGSGWDGAVQVSTNSGSSYAARPDIGVNAWGQILVVWDQDNQIMARFYNGSSWGSQFVADTGYNPAVTAIPGVQDFYMTYVARYGADWDHCGGKRFVNGTLYAQDNVSPGLPAAFIAWTDVCASGNGTVFAAWEYWGSGDCQEWFSKCLDFAQPITAPTIDACSMSSTTLVANDSTQYTVTLRCSDANGVNDLRDMRILFDYNLDGQVGPCRGYLVWGTTVADINYYGETWTTGTCTGGGYWGFCSNNWGYQYITPVSATMSTNGTQRIVTWTFKVKPLWATNGPLTGNFASMYARDAEAAIVGWQRSSDRFGLTFTVQAAGGTGSISGTVNSSLGGAISGATVTTTTGGYTATTNSSGQYTLSNVTPATYSVVASKTNYNTGTNNGVVVTSGNNTVSNFTLTPQPGTIAGTVTASGGGAISGATVSTTTGGYSATTNASGGYTLSSVAVGTYSVVASKSGYNPGTNTGVVVTSNQTRTSNFVLTVSGNLVSNGNMEGGFYSTGWAATCSGYTSKLPNPSGSAGWGWNNDTSYPFNTFDETSNKHAGSHSLGFAFCQTAASPGKMGITYQNINLGGSGVSKTFTVWARHGNGNCPSLMCWNPGQNQSNPYTANSAGRYQWVCTDNWGQINTWVTRSMTVTADSSGYVTIMVGGAAHTGTPSGAKVYIDDVSVQ